MPATWPSTSPASRYVELAGEDHLPWCGDADALLDEVREFLTGERAETEPDRILTTILFCDIADSTRRLAEMGDLGWKQVLASFYALADDKLRHFRGRKLDTAGDGLFAAFDGPARAVRCGASLARAVEALGLQLRVGVHTGECEVLGEKYSGMAVHVGARVASAGRAGPGARLLDGEEPGRRLGPPLRRHRPARAEGRAGRVASVRGDGLVGPAAPVPSRVRRAPAALPAQRCTAAASCAVLTGLVM